MSGLERTSGTSLFSVSIRKSFPLMKTKVIGRNNPTIRTISALCILSSVDAPFSVFLYSSNFLAFIFQNIEFKESCNLSTSFYFVNKPLMNVSAKESNQSTLF